VLHHLVGEEFAGEIVNNLMDVNSDAAVGFGDEVCGFDVWVEDGPLTSPVVADLYVTVGATVFHQVGPVHVVMHEVEYCIDIASVEVFVGGGEDVLVSLHGVLLWAYRHIVSTYQGRGCLLGILRNRVRREQNAGPSNASLAVKLQEAPLRMTLFMKSIL
jgi:hypothetical protein